MAPRVFWHSCLLPPYLVSCDTKVAIVSHSLVRLPWWWRWRWCLYLIPLLEYFRSGKTKQWRFVTVNIKKRWRSVDPSSLVWSNSKEKEPLATGYIIIIMSGQIIMTEMLDFKNLRQGSSQSPCCGDHSLVFRSCEKIMMHDASLAVATASHILHENRRLMLQWVRWLGLSTKTIVSSCSTNESLYFLMLIVNLG